MPQTEKIPTHPSDSASRTGDDKFPIENMSSSRRDDYVREAGHALQDHGQSRDPEGGNNPPAPIAQGQGRDEDEPPIEENRIGLANNARSVVGTYVQQEIPLTSLQTDSVNDLTVSEESRDTIMHQDPTHTNPSSPIEGYSQNGQQAARTDQEKPDMMQRKGSLLERLAPGPAPGQQGGRDDASTQEAAPGGEPPEKTRPRRARRSGRANRR
jgi:hypothetical protein